MKKLFFLSALTLIGLASMAQKKITTSGTIAFDATTGLDRLSKAENKTVVAAIDTKTGVVQFEATVKNFAFDNPTVQHHFNSTTWLDSDKYPKFTYTGKITDLTKVNFEKDGTYEVPVSGDLTIRNITKPLAATGTITVKGGTLNAVTTFTVKLSDYQITGVPIDAGKVSREPKIRVNADLK